jgi:hypothetical protein
MNYSKKYYHYLPLVDANKTKFVAIGQVAKIYNTYFFGGKPCRAWVKFPK